MALFDLLTCWDRFLDAVEFHDTPLRSAAWFSCETSTSALKVAYVEMLPNSRGRVGGIRRIVLQDLAQSWIITLYLFFQCTATIRQACGNARAHGNERCFFAHAGCACVLNLIGAPALRTVIQKSKVLMLPREVLLLPSDDLRSNVKCGFSIENYGSSPAAGRHSIGSIGTNRAVR